MKFKAAMFDYDGTVTEKGMRSPASYVVEAIINLAKRVPIAFCTGRDLDSFLEHGLADFFSFFSEGKGVARSEFLSNLCLIAENGSIGYFFDIDEGKFKEFYRVPWPDEFISMGNLKKLLTPLIRDAGIGEVMNVHEAVLVVRTSLTRKLGDVSLLTKINALSYKIYGIVRDVLMKLDQNFENYLHIGDSGIGVVVCPADGDKDNGIRRFAEFLKKTRGLSFGDNAREIVAIGDKPQFDGNDHYFLNGKFGSPFTVGFWDGIPDHYPLPVFDSTGKRLLNAEGTYFLIKSLF